MEFSHPDSLFLLVSSLLGVVFITVLFAAFFAKKRQAKTFLFYRFSIVSFSIKSVLFGGAIVLLLLGLLEPRIVTSERTSVPYRDARILFLLDVSKSMVARSTPDSPSRFDRAKAIIQGSAGELDRSEVSLYTFTQAAIPRVPFTSDYQYLFDSLERAVKILAFPKPGSNITNALIVSINALTKEPREVKILVLLTDGEHRVPGTDTSFLSSFKTDGIVLIIVGIGEEDERIPIFEEGKFTGRYETMKDGREYVSSLNERLLRDIAVLADGRYFHERDQSSLNALLRQEVEKSKVVKEHEEFTEHEYSFAPLFFLASATLFVILLVWKYK